MWKQLEHVHLEAYTFYDKDILRISTPNYNQRNCYLYKLLGIPVKVDFEK